MKKHFLYFAWMIALSGFLISLYFGEVLHLEPCHLCWYQRIAIVPLALFLGIAAYHNDRKLAKYCLPLIIFGAVAAIYQSMTHIFPSCHSSYLCGASQCSISGISPYLSAAGFVLMGFFVLRAEN
jgi:disulfide bond formation protein DsbB